MLFDGAERSDRTGPFDNTGQIVCGFWIWKLDSLDEAIDWAKRIPNPTGEKAEIEIRQVFESVDFGEEFTPELQEQEASLREKIAERAGAGIRIVRCRTPRAPFVVPASGAFPSRDRRRTPCAS